MEYLTTFSFNLVNGPEEQYNKLLKDIEEITGIKDVSEYESLSAKWYDADEDLKQLSKKYPDITFSVWGDGEDSEDVWQQFWHAGEVFSEGLEFSSYQDIKDHMSLGLALAQRSERYLISEIITLFKQGAELTFKDGPVNAYIVDNSDSFSDYMVEMEVRHLNVSGRKLFAFLALPTEKEYTRDEALAFPEQKNSLSGWYELDSTSFFGLLLPTLCNIRQSIKLTE